MSSMEKFFQNNPASSLNSPASTSRSRCNTPNSEKRVLTPTTKTFGSFNKLKRSKSIYAMKITPSSSLIPILKKTNSKSMGGGLNERGPSDDDKNSGEENGTLKTVRFGLFGYVSPSDKHKTIGIKEPELQIQKTASASASTPNLLASNNDDYESKCLIVERFLMSKRMYPTLHLGSDWVKKGLNGDSSHNFFYIVRCLGELVKPGFFAETFKLEKNPNLRCQFLDMLRDLTVKLAFETNFSTRIKRKDLMIPMSNCAKKDMFLNLLIHLIELARARSQSSSISTIPAESDLP